MGDADERERKYLIALRLQVVPLSKFYINNVTYCTNNINLNDGLKVLRSFGAFRGVRFQGFWDFEVLVKHDITECLIDRTLQINPSAKC